MYHKTQPTRFLKYNITTDQALVCPLKGLF